VAAATVILGIPVPSTDPLFLGIVAAHIAFGLVAVVCGATAMLSRKERGRHSGFGTVYFWSLFGLFATMSVLSFLRWQEDYHLFILGLLAFAAATFGRIAMRRRLPRRHLTGMAASYILMLTAFYVDNGKNLPLWRELPQFAFWIVPSLVGVPLVAYYLVRLPKFKL
jgi:hypothetical protein